MHNARAILRLALPGILALLLASCTPIYRNHGYVPSDAALAEVTVGVDSRDTLTDTLGPPSVSGLVDDDAWYYVASRWRTRGALKPEEVSREVVAISFDTAGTVTNIERFGLKDGRVIVLNRRVTDDNIKGISFLRQLLGNIGQISASDLTNN
ncbi:MAG: outer membrane protein assembly factor BamE [Paracoccaceae bacterium]